MVAVDALQWQQARPEALDYLADEPEFDQLLARALIYRLVTDVILRAGTPGVELAARAGQPVTDLVLVPAREQEHPIAGVLTSRTTARG